MMVPSFNDRVSNAAIIAYEQERKDYGAPGVNTGTPHRQTSTEFISQISGTMR